jgi:hypothetical protein
MHPAMQERQTTCRASGLPCFVIDDDFDREQDRLQMMILDAVGMGGEVS